MSIREIRDYVESLGGVLTLAPGPGDGTPAIAWGDLFFYYAPDGVLPSGQPFATVVTKDYPDDAASELDRPGHFRVNIAAGTAEFKRVAAAGVDPATVDALFPHPVYAAQHWVSAINPAEGAGAAVRELLATAHALARARAERRDA